MKAPFLARKTHKWLALFIGIQATFWMISGAYMATIDIDYIHGDPLVRNTDEVIGGTHSGLYSINTVLNRFPQATAVELVVRQGQPHFVVTTGSTSLLLDANTGEQRSPISQVEAIQLANYYYAGSGEIVGALLLSDETAKPSEIQTRPLPLWQVRFNDPIETTFYVSPSTGQLITRRHTFWRLYDFLWMFHIMDYENRSDVNNNLLRVAALLGFIFTLSGGWLLVYSLRRRQPLNDLQQEAIERHDLVPKTP